MAYTPAAMVGTAAGPNATEVVFSQRRQHVRLALAAALLGALAVYGLLLVIHAAWIQPLRGGVIVGLLQLASSLAPPTFAVVAGMSLYYRLATPQPPAPLILWLRKFHQVEQGRTPFHRILQRAASGYGVTLTIRDTRVSASLVRGALSLIVSLPLAVVGLEVFFFVLWALAMWVSRDVPGAPVFGFVVAFAGASVPAYAMYRFTRSRGVVTLRSAHKAEELLGVLRTLEQRPHELSAGVLVVKTDDADWQSVVRAAIRRASVVLVDITDPSENVVWEITTTLEEKPAASLILARGVDDNTDVNGRVFVYPSFVTRSSRRSVRLLVSRLAMRLAQGIVAAAGAPGGRALHYDRSAMRRVAVISGAVLLASIAAGRVLPIQPSHEELRRLTFAAIGTPAKFVTAPGEPLPSAPNDALAATFRYVVKLERDRRYGESVIQLMPSHRDATNAWLLLARGRAFLLNGECDCTSPRVISISTHADGGVAVNDGVVSESSIVQAIQPPANRTGKRRIVFVKWGDDADVPVLLRMVGVVSFANFVVAVAPDDLSELRGLCGAESVPPVRF